MLSLIYSITTQYFLSQMWKFYHLVWGSPEISLFRTGLSRLEEMLRSSLQSETLLQSHRVPVSGDNSKKLDRFKPIDLYFELIKDPALWNSIHKSFGIKSPGLASRRTQRSTRERLSPSAPSKSGWACKVLIRLVIKNIRFSNLTFISKLPKRRSLKQKKRLQLESFYLSHSKRFEKIP